MYQTNNNSLTKFIIQDRCGGRDVRVACTTNTADFIRQNQLYLWEFRDPISHLISLQSSHQDTKEVICHGVLNDDLHSVPVLGRILKFDRIPNTKYIRFLKND